MPNHVITNIHFENEELFRKVAVNEKEEIDFNILLPQPKDLNGNFSWETEDKYGFGGERLQRKLKFQTNFFNGYLMLFYDEKITQRGFINRVRKAMATDEQLIRRFANIYDMPDNESINSKPTVEKFIGKRNPTFISVIGGFFNYKRYGQFDWYNWRLENWGTKWNAYDCFVNNNVVTFNTAWSTPKEWLTELAKHVDFKFSFSDEDMGCNLGIGIAKDGILSMTYFDRDETLNSLDRQYLALVIHGYEYEEEMDMYDDMEDEPVERLSKERQQELLPLVEEYI